MHLLRLSTDCLFSLTVAIRIGRYTREVYGRYSRYIPCEIHCWTVVVLIRSGSGFNKSVFFYTNKNAVQYIKSATRTHGAVTVATVSNCICSIIL